jgi:hypothetical protein
LAWLLVELEQMLLLAHLPMQEFRLLALLL